MRKNKILFIALITFFGFNIDVFAASGSLSVSSNSVYVGDNFTVYANINSAAAWNVHVSASGSVSGCSINAADATSDAMDTNKTFSATCTATGTGIITLNLSGDVTSASDGLPVSIFGSKSVTVSQRPTQPTQPNNNNNNNNNNNKTNNINSNNNVNNNQVDGNKSRNNNIKELNVEGYELIKIDDNNYSVTVPNHVTSVNIKSTSEDSNASITGNGNHIIKIGENNIEIIITAENGEQRKINIKVVRKDGYYLEDLETAIKNSNGNDININIKSDEKISINDLNKIKTSKKTVRFNYYTEDKNLLYTWIINGSKLKNLNEFITTISFDSQNKKDILRLSNYADGLFISFKQSSNLPTGSRIKLYVGNKFDAGVNVYSFNKGDNKLNLVGSKLKVKDNYIEFDVVDASDILLTMSTIPNINDIVKVEKNYSSVILPIFISIMLLFIIAIIIIFILKKRHKKEIDIYDNKDYDNSNQEVNTTITDYNIKEVPSPVVDCSNQAVSSEVITQNDQEDILI